MLYVCKKYNSTNNMIKDILKGMKYNVQNIILWKEIQHKAGSK